MDVIAVKVRRLKLDRSTIDVQLPFAHQLSGPVHRRQMKALHNGTLHFIEFKCRLMGNRMLHLWYQIEVGRDGEGQLVAICHE